MGIRRFIDDEFHHFNAGELARCARSLTTFLDDGGRLMLTLAGAMSTAGIGRTLAAAIRAGHIDAICCTGANLEEDLFALIGRDRYEAIPDWRSATPEDDADLLARGLNRVTDVAIPEAVIREAEAAMLDHLEARSNDAGGVRPIRPVDLLKDLATGLALDEGGQCGGKVTDSWLVAAAECGTALFCPGFEDSTLGNIIAARTIQGTIGSGTITTGFDEMSALADWYRSDTRPAGFLQVGGGIAGDFAISVVPMLRQDLGEAVPLWAWFAQISESRPSYGGYSGAPPSEKISWEKTAVDTPRFVIESDATIVLPLLLAHLLDR